MNNLNKIFICHDWKKVIQIPHAVIECSRGLFYWLGFVLCGLFNLENFTDKLKAFETSSFNELAYLPEEGTFVVKIRKNKCNIQ